MRVLKFSLCLFFALCTSAAFSQKGILQGTIKDAISDESLPTAFIMWGEGKGAAADIDGRFNVELDYGSYTISFNSVGYQKQDIKITINKAVTRLDVALTTIELQEVVVTADYAIGRKVPVAFTNIPLKRVEEELASREVATLANTTPGAYATRSGGGDGDARVTIRGFGGNNVAVMLDGVPVNDMETGQVYWSNWFGLDVVMQTTQIQRGLGASKLVIPAVGGTINIITKGIDTKRKTQIKQEYIYGGFARTSIGFASGKLKNDWAFSGALSYKKGNGWVQGTPTEGLFWYVKAEKIIKKHTISAYALGAPQNHGQRSRADAIGVYDRNLANKLGADSTYTLGTNTSSIPEYGINYNSSVGPLQRYDYVNGTKDNFQRNESFNGNVNYFHKPQFSLKDVYRINDRTFMTSVLYASIGNGGGTSFANTSNISNYLPNGDLNVQHIYDNNVGALPQTVFGQTITNYNINDVVAPGERYAYENWVRSSVNKHKWAGFLANVNHKIGENLTFAGGVDLRAYRASHYRQVYDLLGADYLWDRTDFNPNDPTLIHRVGDKTGYHNDALVKWGGVFGQLEYSKKRLSAFFSLSAATTAYKRIDYFLPKVYTSEAGVDYTVAYHPNPTSTAMIADSKIIDGKVITPTSEGLHFQETSWYHRQTFTTKAGVSYEFSDRISAFINGGYMNKAPLFNQIYNNSNARFEKIYNEIITSVEVGAAWKSEKFTTHVNAYFTDWKNRPWTGNALSYPNPQDPQQNISFNIQGISERHMGAEMDMAYKINKKITFEGLASWGNWFFTSKDSIYLFDQNNVPVTVNGTPTGKQVVISYDANNVHVNDAAQFQLAGMLRYEPKDGLYFKTRYTWFDRYYAQANIQDLNGVNAGRDSWRIPGYGQLELHAGYGFNAYKVRWDIRGSMFNVLNQHVITDAYTNYTNGLYNNKDGSFSASSAGVYFAQSRWFNLSLTASF